MAVNPVLNGPIGRLTDVDAFGNPERILGTPWVSDPAASWLDYDCWVEVYLDSGMCLHKILPQSNPSIDTLGSITIDARDFNTAIDRDVNLNSSSSDVDIIQRMASSTYRFVLKGQAQRFGYKVPIPFIKKIGNQTPVPVGTQLAFNKCVGNFSGVPLWFAAWIIAYVVAGPVRKAKAPLPFNPAAFYRTDARLPATIGLPDTPRDSRAVVRAVLTAGRIS